MAKLFSYTCAKCGGVLNSDSDQEILFCPFCGEQLDLVEYHRKDILSQAELCLKRMEYNSAYERYKELHNNNPKDFEALRGLILCAGKIPVKEDLVIPKKLIRHNPERAATVLRQLAEDCADYPYFQKLEEVIKLSIEFGKAAKKGAKEPGDELCAVCDELQKLEPATVESVTYSAKLNNAKVDPDTESVSDIICIKCGGQLMMDKKRNLCECRFCGVAYGTSLFFGEPNKRAKEALVKQEFSEADQRYSYMLMLDAHDFEALRGRVLCAAKWSSPRVESDISSFWVNNLRSRVVYAIGKAREEDKPYFEKYIEMMDEYNSVLSENNKLKSLNRQREELIYKRNHIVIDRDPEDEERPQPVYAHETIAATISELEEKINWIEFNKNAHLDKVRGFCGQIQEMDSKWLIRKASENK